MCSLSQVPYNKLLDFWPISLDKTDKTESDTKASLLLLPFSFLSRSLYWIEVRGFWWPNILILLSLSHFATVLEVCLWSLSTDILNYKWSLLSIFGKMSCALKSNSASRSPNWLAKTIVCWIRRFKLSVSSDIFNSSSCKSQISTVYSTLYVHHGII